MFTSAAAAAAAAAAAPAGTGVFPEFSLLNHSCAPNTAAPVLLRNRLLLRTAVGVPAGEELTTSYLSTAGGMPRQQRQQLLQQTYGFVCSCHRCKVRCCTAGDTVRLGVVTATMSCSPRTQRATVKAAGSTTHCSQCCCKLCRTSLLAGVPHFQTP
jgi:SET and MYND domain-containing protein